MTRLWADDASRGTITYRTGSGRSRNVRQLPNVDQEDKTNNHGSIDVANDEFINFFSFLFATISHIINRSLSLEHIGPVAPRTDGRQTWTANGPN